MLDIKLLCDTCEKPAARVVLYTAEELQEWLGDWEPGDGQHTCRECIDHELLTEY